MTTAPNLVPNDDATISGIPLVARAGLAIITRDKHIQERRSRKDAVVAGARMFAITSAGPLVR